MKQRMELNHPNICALYDLVRQDGADYAANGQRFLIPQPGAGPTVAGGLADFIAAQADQSGAVTSGANSITVVLNWPQMLKRK